MRRTRVTMNLVGIATIVDDANFGNRLQNYALQQTLKCLGWQPETIRNTPPPMDKRLVAARAAYALRRNPLEFARRNSQLLRHKLITRGAVARPRFADQRRAAITAFAEQHIRTSTVDYSDLPRDWWGQRYHRLVAGSDQVWNPGFRNAQGFDFLDFAAPAQRIAYAASFGVPDIPDYLRPKYRDWLLGIPHISVREERAAEIVADLTGREVPVVLDPTLLVDRSVWDSLLQGSPTSAPADPYAVRFFLGEPTAEQEAWVNASTNLAGLPVFDLNNLDLEEFCDLDPSGFIAMIAGANQVFTDSFHAAVFSVLYARPLAIRDRHTDDSRLMTLMNLHGLGLHPTGVGGLNVADTAGGDATRRRYAHQLRSRDFLREALGPVSMEE